MIILGWSTQKYRSTRLNCWLNGGRWKVESSRESLCDSHDFLNFLASDSSVWAISNFCLSLKLLVNISMNCLISVVCIRVVGGGVRSHRSHNLQRVAEKNRGFSSSARIPQQKHSIPDKIPSDRKATAFNFFHHCSSSIFELKRIM